MEPTAELEHFAKIALAKPTLDDPSFTPISISRNLTFNGRGHTLMGATFNTPETIAHMLSFFRAPDANSDIAISQTASSSNSKDLKTAINTAELRRFYTFGSGLNAHADLLHGGVLACILDSTMSNAAGLVMQAIAKGKESVVTGQLNVRFEKPVRTPGTVMARAWVTKVEGKKVWVEGRMESGDEGEICHARADGVWIRVLVGKL